MRDLKKITSPSLTISDYGENISQVFNNINENFRILGNRDFVKGEKGNSIYVKTIDVSNDIQLLNSLKSAVSKQYEYEPSNINGYSVLSWFDSSIHNNPGPGSITLIYENIDGTDQLISSLPYIFKDLRFEYISEVIDKKVYDDEVDYSCVIYYDFKSGEFVTVQNFPTIYYDKVLGDFSWKINGVATGLPAMGPKGDKGQNGVFKIVRVNKNAIDKDVYQISHILNKNAWVDVTQGAIEMEGESGTTVIIDNHADLCKNFGVDEGIPVMVLKPEYDYNDINHINLTYISETYKDEYPNDISKSRMVVRLTSENEICEVVPIPNKEIVSLCESYLGKYLVNP